MAAKRASTGFNVDVQTVQGSDFEVLQQEEKAKRAKVASSSVTTLQDLPNELLDCILVKVVTMEVEEARLFKHVRLEKSRRVIARLRSVCSLWNNILHNKVLLNKVYNIVNSIADESIRIEMLQKSVVEIFAVDMVTLKDEVFVLGTKDYGRHDYSIYVYDRNDTAEAKDVIPLPEGNPLSLASCNALNSVYLLSRKFKITVSRITRGDDHQFRTSATIILFLPNPILAVTANGGLILSKRRLEDPAVIYVYGANGSLEHETSVPREISRIRQIVPKSNGNLVLVSREKYQRNSKFTEIDLTGTIQHQYTPRLVGFHSNVGHADRYGRMLVSEQKRRRIALLDSELNALYFSGPIYGGYFHGGRQVTLHYNTERNEIVSIDAHGVLAIFRLVYELSTLD